MENINVTEVPISDSDRIILLEQAQYQLINQLNHFISQPAPPPAPPPPTPQPIHSHPNLNLPQPPSFSGIVTDLPEFKMKMFQFLHGNPHTCTTSKTQLLYAGTLLTVSASQWYRAHVDPVTQDVRAQCENCVLALIRKYIQ